MNEYCTLLSKYRNFYVVILMLNFVLRCRLFRLVVTLLQKILPPCFIQIGTTLGYCILLATSNREYRLCFKKAQV